MYSIVGMAYAQNATPAPVTPTPTNQPTPTTPTPNFQYLPQKAYVQPFKPEVGIPESAIPLTAVPQVIPQQQVQPSQQTGSGFPTDIMGILAAVGAAGAYLKGHVAKQKADKAEDLGKEALGSDAQTKSNLAEFARVSYEKMPDGGASINNAPAVKLENLNNDAKEATDKAAKA